jgi:hypothetical protein
MRPRATGSRRASFLRARQPHPFSRSTSRQARGRF